MGDDPGDEAISMGWDSQGPVHHWGSDEIGALPGLHGVHGSDIHPPLAPDGTPLPDVHIPPPPPAEHESWFDGVEGFAHRLYEELTAAPEQQEPNPYTEEADRQRHADEVMSDETTGTHTVNAPKQHF